MTRENGDTAPNGAKLSVDASLQVQSPSSATITQLLMKQHAAVKVIKGEIHNVLNVLRSNERYLSKDRFTDEMDIEQHPIVQQLQDLHKSLNAEEAVVLDPRQYLKPFCASVESREINAAVTGAALSALQKFLLYGFLLPEQTQHAADGMTLIASSILACSFEESEDKRRNNQTVADEQVVLKLLDLAALVVRCSLQSINLLEPELIVGLLDTCLHVSHRAKRASPLLKSAAADALSQIVLQVFAGTGEPVMRARKEILSTLSTLCNPSLHSEEVTVSSLTAVNIALETVREDLTSEEIQILQNDLCKYLLQWSTTKDLVILSLTLRVIFNLFQTIRNHLKVPLEVFLTSVHLRILESAEKATPEEREVALESLLEFCQEPLLMQDLYLNYDCDVACTNLYESVVTTLGKVAQPDGWESVANKKLDEPTTEDALSGDSDATGDGPALNQSSHHGKDAGVGSSSPVNHINRLAVEAILAILESISKRTLDNGRITSFGYVPSEDENDEGSAQIESLEQVAEIEAHELHERRLKKATLSKIANAFNANPGSDKWKILGVSEGMIQSATSPAEVAGLLYTAPGVDKVKLGDYLGKGPEDKYPFHARVRQEFVALYDFSEMSFANALRKYLSKFRLPGEAQCIDRLMVAFSSELFKQQGHTTIFKNEDAMYVLAFSTIMLNTDLHNPQIKNEKRMTVEQFIKNNRGINDKEDLPSDFIAQLYNEIKERQIQVRREIGEFMMKHEHEDFRATWDHLLTKTGEVATAFFTPAGQQLSKTSAGIHDKEMFQHLAKSALKCLPGIFMRSWDDNLVIRVCHGMQDIVRIAAVFGMGDIIDRILVELLPAGRDYVISCVADDVHQHDSGGSVISGAQSVSAPTLDSAIVDTSDTEGTDSADQIPFSVLMSTQKDPAFMDATGCATHRGLLALDTSFCLMRKHSDSVIVSWPSYIECLCVLRDASALPAVLSDLDDFADSNGHVLPLSINAKASRRRMDEYYKSVGSADAGNQKGWFRALPFFDRKKPKDDTDSLDDDQANRSRISTYGKLLRQIALAGEVERTVQMSAVDVSTSKRIIESLLDTVSEYPYDNDPILEQHALFSLELATRSLLSNRDTAVELFPIFLEKFESILNRVPFDAIPCAFVIERIVVTLLRCSIHLFDIEELRTTLRTSLHLLFMSLPKSFFQTVADRVSCGLAIILRASYQYFQTPGEWTLISDNLDMLAHYQKARVLVFDGIAATVERALPSDSDAPAEGAPLSKEACNALSKTLSRFVLGYYEKDRSLTVPAVLCLEKVYRQRVCLLVADEDGGEAKEDDTKIRVPDVDAWQNIAVTMYSVAKSSDPDASAVGMESFSRVVLHTDVRDVDDEKWLDIISFMIDRQPPISADVSRANAFHLLGYLMCMVLPRLSRNEEIREDLSDLVNECASVAAENLRHGRRGKDSPVFNKTLQTVTYIANHMQSDEWDGEKDFSAWASEMLFAELRKVGATGGTVQNQAAVAKRDSQNDLGVNGGESKSAEAVAGA